MPATTESLGALLTPVIAANGWELEELSITPASRRSVLRVTVDGDQPIDLDAVAELSRLISSALDDSDAFGNRPYVLEVSSPGVERPLTEFRHWRRAVGRLVEVVPKPGTRGDGRPLTGRLVAAGETTVTLEVDGELQEMSYSRFARARVQVEFRRRDENGDGDGDGDSGDESAEGSGASAAVTDAAGHETIDTTTDGATAPGQQSEGAPPWTST